MAQTSSEIAAARAWFEEGIVHEEAGRWQQALDSFRRAAQVKKTPQILFHQGLCEKHLGLLVEAGLSLSRAVSMAHKENLEKVEQAANTELKEVRGRTPSIRIVLPSGERPDHVLLDGEELSPVFLTQPVPVNPGTHEVKLITGEASVQQSATVKEQDVATLRFESLPIREPAAPTPAELPTAASSTAPATASPGPAPTAPAPPLDSHASGNSTLAWSLLGAGVLATAGGVTFWLKRNDQLQKIDDICPSRDQCPQERKGEVDDLESKGTVYGGVGIGLLGAGLAAATVGVVLLSSGDEGSGQPNASISPVLGPGQAGAWLQGRF